MPPMSNKPTKSRKKETTVREVVVKGVQDTYELDGLEAAREKFKTLRELLADYTPEWSTIAEEAEAFLKEKKKEEQEAVGERQMNSMNFDLPPGQGVTVVMTQINSPTTTNTTTIGEQYNDNCLQMWGKVENSKFVTPQTDGTA